MSFVYPHFVLPQKILLLHALQPFIEILPPFVEALGASHLLYGRVEGPHPAKAKFYLSMSTLLYSSLQSSSATLSLH